MMSTLVRITVSEICEQEGLSAGTVSQLVEFEIARPLAGSSTADWQFDATGAHWMKRAVRLQRDLEIDWVTVATLIDLLRERERLLKENQCLRQRLERFLLSEES
jgi:chaperone modulatory protein CbpM